MECIIVAKTQMKLNECVGGICTDTGRFVRLLLANGLPQPRRCPYEIGQIWQLQFREPFQLNRPHVEDIWVTQATNTSHSASVASLSDWIQHNFSDHIWMGGPQCLYDGRMDWSSTGSGYLDDTQIIPSQSVGFWIADRNLVRVELNGKWRYYYHDKNNDRRKRLFPYVGLGKTVSVIPAGTLLRVSLARWWSPDLKRQRKRCYLQLSGWYHPVEVCSQ